MELVAQDPSAWRTALASNLAGTRRVLDSFWRDGTEYLVRSLDGHLDHDERLLCWVQAKRRDMIRANVVIALTDRRLYVGQDGGRMLTDVERRRVSVATHLANDFMWGQKFALIVGGERHEYRQPLPVGQAARLLRLLDGRVPDGDRTLLADGQDPDPGAPPVTSYWNLDVYADRMVDQDGRHLPFAGGEVTATVDTAGSIAVTRGRNLAAKGAGTLLFGPVGLLMAGNAKHREVDTRELYLLVEGPTWSYAQAFLPASGASLRQFAGELSAVARRHQAAAQSQPPVAQPGPSLSDELHKLADLRDRGVLTDEEFAQAKARLLSG